MQYGSGHEGNEKTENPVYIFFFQASDRKSSKNHPSFYRLANGFEMAEIH
jgi:hypothetical protein